MDRITRISPQIVFTYDDLADLLGKMTAELDMLDESMRNLTALIESVDAEMAVHIFRGHQALQEKYNRFLNLRNKAQETIHETNGVHIACDYLSRALGVKENYLR